MCYYFSIIRGTNKQSIDNKLVIPDFFEVIFMRNLLVFILLNFVMGVSAGVEIHFSMENPGDFSQRTPIAEKLTSLIRGARRRVYIAIYSITLDEVKQAIIDIKNTVLTDEYGKLQWVDVRVIVDKKQPKEAEESSAHNKIISDLTSEGVKVRTFDPVYLKLTKGAKGQVPLMHNKYAIIDDIYWSGSFNFTKAAELHNHENVVIVRNDKNAIGKATGNFENLWAYCKKHSKEAEKTPSASSSQPILSQYPLAIATTFTQRTRGFLLSVPEPILPKPPSIISQAATNVAQPHQGLLSTPGPTRPQPIPTGTPRFSPYPQPQQRLQRGAHHQRPPQRGQSGWYSSTH
jgi:hypothetical protein